MKKKYFLNANIIDPHNSLNEVGGLIINEEGKIESIFGINTRKSKFEDRYDTNQYNKMILPRNLKFYNKKILLVSDHFNHQILAISIK